MGWFSSRILFTRLSSSRSDWDHICDKKVCVPGRLFDESVREFGHEAKVIKYQTNKEYRQKMQYWNILQSSNFFSYSRDMKSRNHRKKHFLIS